MIWPVYSPSAMILHSTVFERALLPAGAGDGNRTRMTSLEGVLPRAVRSAELDGSLSSVGRGWPVRTGVNGPLMAHPEAWVWALVRASSRLVRCSRTAGTWRAGDCKCG